MRRQQERTGRRALTDDTKQALILELCVVALERHLLIDSDRYGTYPKPNSVSRDSAKQTHHKSDHMRIDEMAHPADEEYGASREVVHAGGYAKGKSTGKGKGKGKGCKHRNDLVRRT